MVTTEYERRKTTRRNKRVNKVGYMASNKISLVVNE
jgi:hypothetical protein